MLAATAMCGRAMMVISFCCLGNQINTSIIITPSMNNALMLKVGIPLLKKILERVSSLARMMHLPVVKMKMQMA